MDPRKKNHPENYSREGVKWDSCEIKEETYWICRAPYSVWLVSHCTWCPMLPRNMCPGWLVNSVWMYVSIKVLIKHQQDSAKFSAHSRHSALGELGSSVQRAVGSWSPDSEAHYIAQLSSQVSLRILVSLWPWNRNVTAYSVDTLWQVQLCMATMSPVGTKK